MPALPTINAAEWSAKLHAVISTALTETMGAFQQAVQGAYAGTTFADSFVLRPAPILTEAALLGTRPLLEVVEYPTAPHPIHARNVANLHFYWTNQGRWFRGPAVNHPGTAGKGYIDPLFAQAGAEVGARLSALMEAWNA